MKILLCIFLAVTVFLFRNLNAQDTFSICAVDPATGEVGSAGASCVNDCTILTDVHPGYGVIHTQSYWNPQNQNYARELMNQHIAPQAIIDSLVLHDAQSDPTIRQYGIVDLINNGRTAAYTGVNCFDYKNHILGPTYSIQGNILLGSQILDSMQSRFLNTTGTLSEKLMAAMQGAKVIGADTRCATWNTSSLSAFIRVAKPWDTTGSLYLNLKVLGAPFGRDPIDSLQVLYNQWLTSVKKISSNVPDRFSLKQNYPNPFNPETKIRFDIMRNGDETVEIIVYDVLGKKIEVIVNEKLLHGSYEIKFSCGDLPSGIYFYRLTSGNFSETKRMMLLK